MEFGDMTIHETRTVRCPRCKTLRALGSGNTTLVCKCMKNPRETLTSNDDSDHPNRILIDFTKTNWNEQGNNPCIGGKKVRSKSAVEDDLKSEEQIVTVTEV